MMYAVPHITQVTPLQNYFLEIVFDDGETKKVDIKPFIKKGVSTALKDENYFKTVKAENGYIFWENGFDFCPEFLKNYL